MKIEYLSASRLQVFCDCPFRYFLQYHLKLPELGLATISTHKGSAVHESLDRYVKGETDYTSTLKEYYAEHKVWEFDNRKPDRGFPHPQPKSCQTCPWASQTPGGTICTIAARDVSSFGGCPRANFEEDLAIAKLALFRENSPLKRKIIGAEVPFQEVFENFKVQGFIDLVTEIDDETLEVRDYKTGNFTKKTDEAWKDLQMRIYSLIIKKMYPKYKYVLMTLDYLKKTPITVCFSAEDDEKTLQFLGRAYKEIVNAENPERKKSFKCTWCVGYEECGKIRERFLDKNGKFVMPPATEKAVEIVEDAP